MDTCIAKIPCTEFNSEEECVRILYQLKWPDGFLCQRCNHSHAYYISTRRLPLYECSSCHAQTSLIAGTIMEGTRTSLCRWFRAIFLHTEAEGINALQLSRIIEVTYKTAWLMCHKIRHGMSRKELDELLTALVRVTDARLCNRPTGSSEWHRQEQSVLVGSSENESGDIQRIKIKKQDKQRLRHRYDSPPTERFLAEHVDPKAALTAIVTRWLGGNRNHALVRIARNAERQLAIMFRGIGPKHLQVYLDQFCYVWNRRNQPLFPELLQTCATTSTITYNSLIRGVNVVSNKLWSHKSVATALKAG
jgi:hypothetical protein